MKKLLVVFVGCAFAVAVNAQTVAVNSTGTFNTGHKDLDASLNTINQLAVQNLDAFKQDMSTQYNVPVSNIQNLLDKGATPGEVYLAHEVSTITQQPVEKVVTTYQKNKGKGWGVVAKELGIKPGSPEFFDLKEKANKKKEEMENKDTKGNKEGDQGDDDDDKDKDHGDKDKDHGDKDKKDKDDKGDKGNKGNSGNNGKGHTKGKK